MFINLPENFYMKVQYDKNLLIYRKEINIGISLPVGGGEIRWPEDGRLLEDYAKKQNAILTYCETSSSTSQQSTEIDALLLKNIDVLIIAPVNSEEASTIVEKVKKAGVKVVAYDRMILNSDVDFFVTYSSLSIGELQGRYLTTRAPRGNYIFLSGGNDDANSILLKEGAMVYIRPLQAIGNIKIVTDASINAYNTEVTYNVVKNSLLENNNIVAILAPNDAMAGASIKALEEEGLAGKVLVTGHDAELDTVKRILNGTQAMTVFTDFRKEAQTAIDIAINLASNKILNIYPTVYNGEKNVPSILLTPVTVDRNNVNEVLINSGYIKFSDIYTLHN
ncbi:sugar ABC transporter substrate-binding protein [Clostridium sp. UBA1652]|uniref:sugar ABC transporter substrate-binding protein n=1 Tax=Clostridium sp. UBA1652 TaxID=1946348 RepID=UPI00257BC6B1|nr:substrate-binding domain-containing protein [Clostridium sp. UBA1652]